MDTQCDNKKQVGDRREQHKPTLSPDHRKKTEQELRASAADAAREAALCPQKPLPRRSRVRRLGLVWRPKCNLRALASALLC